jgi:hypothetical protein
MKNETIHDIVEDPDSMPGSQLHLEELPLRSIALSCRSNLRWLFLLGALFLPFAVATCFIIVTRELIIVDTTWDYLGWGLSVVPGLCCVWQVPTARLSRFVMSLVYVPIVSWFLLNFAFWFTGFKYGQWM